jgi:hypothetical protein
VAICTAVVGSLLFYAVFDWALGLSLPAGRIF